MVWIKTVIVTGYTKSVLFSGKAPRHLNIFVCLKFSASVLSVIISIADFGSAVILKIALIVSSQLLVEFY